jgi:hypothetical protein
MMAAAFELFDWDHLRFTEDEQKRVDAHALDSLLIAYYKLHNMIFTTSTRPSGPKGGLPLVPRLVFRSFIWMNIHADPVCPFRVFFFSIIRESSLTHTFKPAMRRKINAILKAQKGLVDPCTEMPFQSTVIPPCAFPAEPHAQAKAVIDTCTTKWRELRSQVLQQSIANQQSFSSGAAGRLAQPVSPTPTQPPPQSQPLFNSTTPQAPPPPSQTPPPRRSEAQIRAQLQAFRPLPGESDTASRARFDAIVQGVDDATLDRLLGHARRQENLTAMNAANAMSASTQMQIQAVSDGFRSQNAAMGVWDTWIEKKWVWR